MEAHFLTTQVDIAERETIQQPTQVHQFRDGRTFETEGTKHEEVTLTIKLISSGNTSIISDNEIKEAVMKRLEIIQPPKE